MSGVQSITVAADEAEIRLDRWFRRHFPGARPWPAREAAAHRADPARRPARRGRRPGRAGPGRARAAAGRARRRAPTAAAAADPRRATRRCCASAVLHRDDDVIVIDKPPGLAVQGGTGTERHLDALLDALRFDADGAAAPRPSPRQGYQRRAGAGAQRRRRGRARRRLSRQGGAQDLLGAHGRRARSRAQGRIDLPLAKLPGRGGERVVRRRGRGQARHHLLSHRRACRRQDRLARARAGDRPHASAARALRGDRHADPRRRQIWRRRRASGGRAATRGSSIFMPAPFDLPHPRRRHARPSPRRCRRICARPGRSSASTRRRSAIPSPVSRRDSDEALLQRAPASRRRTSGFAVVLDGKPVRTPAKARARRAEPRARRGHRRGMAGAGRARSSPRRCR